MEYIFRTTAYDVAALTPEVGKALEKRANRFEKAARKFLSGVSKAETAEVLFSEEGMVIEDRPLIPYSDIKDFLETQSGYLITWADQATFLQKKDFQGESLAEFADFVRSKI